MKNSKRLWMSVLVIVFTVVFFSCKNNKAEKVEEVKEEMAEVVEEKKEEMSSDAYLDVAYLLSMLEKETESENLKNDSM